MIVGVNGRFLSKPYTGIAQYTRFLYEALARNNPTDRFILVVPKADFGDFFAGSPLRQYHNIEIVCLEESFLGTAGMRKTFWEQYQVPRYFLKRGVDLVHFPYPSNPWRGFKKPTVVTVHDTIPWSYDAYRKSASTRLYQNKARDAVKMADHVLTVSECSKKEIMDVCDVPSQKISVTYNAVSPEFFNRSTEKECELILKKHGIPMNKPYFLYMGGYDERKNVPMIAEAFKKNISSTFDINLVFAGGKSVNDSLYKSYDSLTDKKIRSNVKSQKGNIVVTGFIAEKDLPALYQSAFAFLNLSKKEGFNLPLLEAAVSGVPIITSDLPVHHEIYDEIALFSPTNDSAGLAVILKKLLTDSTFYLKQKQKVEAFVCPYSWDKTAKKVTEVFKNLL